MKYSDLYLEVFNFISIFEEFADQETNNYDENRDPNYIFFDPIFSCFSICFRVVFSIVCILKVLHCLSVVTFAVVALTDSYVCAVEVVVTLDNTDLVFNCFFVFVIKCILESFCDEVTVVGSLKYCK